MYVEGVVLSSFSSPEGNNQLLCLGGAKDQVVVLTPPRSTRSPQACMLAPCCLQSGPLQLCRSANFMMELQV